MCVCVCVCHIASFLDEKTTVLEEEEKMELIISAYVYACVLVPAARGRERQQPSPCSRMKSMSFWSSCFDHAPLFTASPDLLCCSQLGFLIPIPLPLSLSLKPCSVFVGNKRTSYLKLLLLPSPGRKKEGVCGQNLGEKATEIGGNIREGVGRERTFESDRRLSVMSVHQPMDGEVVVRCDDLSIRS